MPDPSSESVRCGQRQAQPQRDKNKQPEGPRSLAQTRDTTTPHASGSQCWGSMEGVRQKQQRPSVLRQVSQTASRRQHESSTAGLICKEEVDAGHLPRSSSPHMASARQSHQMFPLMRDSPKQSAIESGLYDSIPEETSALFVNGICRWPGCDTVSEDFPSFLKHLHSEHRHGDRSITQWKIQHNIIQRMESQLIREKQILNAMQLHLHLSEHKYTDLKAASEWTYSLPLVLSQQQVTDRDAVQQWRSLEELSQHGYRAAPSAHILQDLVPSFECYKYNNIRPPYTYAYLIRWSILESPDKQRTLNEIYNWFTTMFFFFRHNTATWKNAVRHNLSLHKCFVRVEGGKGAVWTVDEIEYQRRKGQKYHRDCPVKWIKSFSRYCPENS